MSKRKRRQKKSQSEWKRTVSFEVIGLLILAFSIIAIAKLGMVGNTIVLFFRFFSGEWYMLLLLGMVILSGYIIWKRDLPPFFTRQLVGTYIIVLSILLLTHVSLFNLLSRGDDFVNPSVIINTWELFWFDVRGETSTSDLGGGMVGAILFSIFHLLFDAKGTRWIATIFIVIGVILVTGRSLNDTVIKVLSALFSFVKVQWVAFMEDMKAWKDESKKKKKQKEAETKKDKEKKKDREQSEQLEQDTVQIVEVEETPPPIISSFTDRSESKQEIKNGNNQVESKVEQNEEPAQEDIIQSPMAFTEVENKDYTLPSLDLLNDPTPNSQSTEHENIYENARKLEKTFASFGVKAKVTKVHLGPAVTKYEVYPDVGVKVRG